MKALRVLLLIPLLIAIVGTACGGGEPAPSPKPAPTVTPAPPPGPDQIPVADMTFEQKITYYEWIKAHKPDLADEVMQILGLLREFMVQARSGFDAAVDQFDAQKQVVQQEFEVGQTSLLTFKDAVKQAKDKYPEFQKVYQEWDKINSQVQVLEEKLASLEAMSETFYMAAKDYAQSITDEEKRTDSLNKLEESEKKYSARLATAQQSVAKLREAKTKVDDTMKALEISYSLEVAEEAMDEVFAEIDKLVTQVMGELESLSEESRDLLNSFASQ